MSPTRILTSLAVAAIILAGCSAAGASPAATSALAVGAQPSGGAGAVPLGTASSATFGSILTGPNGMTLYTYSGDTAGTSTCTGGCATAWPPLTVPAGQQPAAGTGVTGTLSTVARADGTTQVADDGRPLYYWQGDARPGDVTGDGLNGFSVATVPGAPRPAPSASASSAPSSGSGGRYGY